MDNVALYPGSFNPWHEGHDDILQKALKIFDKVVVLQGHNPAKFEVKNKSFMGIGSKYNGRVEVGMFKGLLTDVVKDFPFKAIIRGLRNGHDLQYETNNQYWNEDLGCDIPFVYFICDRKYSHISSSAIREVNEIKERSKKED